MTETPVRLSESGRVRLVNRSGYDTDDLLAVLNAAERFARQDQLNDAPERVARALRAALDRGARLTPHPPESLDVRLRCTHPYCDEEACHLPAGRSGPERRIVVTDRRTRSVVRALADADREVTVVRVPASGPSAGPTRERRERGAERVWVRPARLLPATPIERLLHGGARALPQDVLAELAGAFAALYLVPRWIHARSFPYACRPFLRGVQVRVRIAARPSRADATPVDGHARPRRARSGPHRVQSALSGCARRLRGNQGAVRALRERVQRTDAGRTYGAPIAEAAAALERELGELEAALFAVLTGLEGRP